jgi:hypothetical protein
VFASPVSVSIADETYCNEIHFRNLLVLLEDYTVDGILVIKFSWQEPQRNLVNEFTVLHKFILEKSLTAGIDVWEKIVLSNLLFDIFWDYFEHSIVAFKA